MTWIYRVIALGLTIGVIDYIVHQKSVARKTMAALVLIPLVLRTLMIR